MVLIGLLVVAVVSLVLGLALTSTVWLIVSLVASVLAAAALLLLVRAQRRSATPAPNEDSTKADAKLAADNGAQDKEPARVPVAVGAGSAQSADGTNSAGANVGTPGGADSGEQKKGRFSMSKRAKSKGAAADDVNSDSAGAAAAGVGVSSGHDATDVAAFDEHVEAMVIDGKPDYHRADCAELTSAHGEKVPLAQAIEDGFTPCSTCKPETSVGNGRDDRPADASNARDEVAATASASSQASHTADVWVVDGRPEYHHEHCERVPAGVGEKIPHDQAVEDGFVACAGCRPDDAQPTGPDTNSHGGEPAKESALVAASAEHSDSTGAGSGDASSAQVWVADGYPEYHVHSCGELQGLTPESVAYDRAIEDGFQPCVVCDPDSEIAGRRPAGVQPDSDDDKGPGAASVTGEDTSQPSDSAGGQVWVVDGHADYHRQSCERVGGQDAEQIPRTQAVEDGFTPCATCTPDDVDAGSTPDTSPAAAEPAAGKADGEEPADAWVVDGFPDFHRPQCPKIIGLDSQPIPYDQATEDGFAPCPVCRPDADEAPPMAPVPELVGQAATSSADEGGSGGAATRSSEDMVWVVDGFPDFHRSECAVTRGLDAQQIPGDQAVEDGFTPCATCNPLGDAPAESPSDVGGVGDQDKDTASSGDAQVWVADGFPEYHREGCRTLNGLDDEPIAHDQAVEDGFSACEICRPEDEQAPGGSLGDGAAAEAEAAAKAEADAKAKAEADEKAKAEADAKAKAEADEKAKAEADAKAKAEADEKAEAESDAKAKAEADEKAEAESDAKAKAEADEKAEAESDAKAKAEADEKAKAESDAKAKAEAEEKAKAEADEKAKAEADEKAEADAKAKAEAPPVADSGSASGSARRVWVLDGRPRYHAQDCLIIKGQHAQAVNFDDAVEQGFAPCSLCSRT